LIEAWVAVGESNLFVACPHLRSEVKPPFRFATAADRAAVREIRGNATTVTTFTAPFLNREGTEALVQFSAICPGLCGGGEIRRYQNRGRSWVLVETTGMWIS
jgi:hypothetical protein